MKEYWNFAYIAITNEDNRLSNKEMKWPSLSYKPYTMRLSLIQKE